MKVRAVAARARDTVTTSTRSERLSDVDTQRHICDSIANEVERRCRNSLYMFTRSMWSQVERGTKAEWNWHIQAFCFHVQSMLEGWLVANGHGDDAMRARVAASWNDHGLDYVDGELLVQNLVMNLPPITLKSKILMVLAPAWMWLWCPTWCVWAVSATEDNVKRDSNAHRDLVESERYRKLFRITWKVRDNIDAVTKWATTAGGERKSSTMGGNVTGMHNDCILVDDPDDAHRVHSEAIRKDTQDKWTRATKNRVKHGDKSIRMAIQQRVHVDDWTAAQTNKGVWSPDDRKAWAWWVIPLQFGHAPEEAPVMSPWGWTDPRKVANENLHAARFSDAFIADEIRDKGPDGFAGQYNQNPRSYDDGMIKRSYVRFFRVADEMPSIRPRPHGCGVAPDGSRETAYVLQRRKDGSLDIDWLTITIDASNGAESLRASQVGILVVGGKGALRFVFDDRTAIMGIERMYEVIAETVAAWPVGRVLVELKAAGSSVINDLRKRMREQQILGPDGSIKNVKIEAIKVPPGDSKESRAAAMVSAWSNSHVMVLDGAEWLYPKVIAGGRTIDEGFVGEICGFPGSKKNDRVDAMSQLMAFYANSNDAKERARRFVHGARHQQ